jgi:2-methylcitrate dehydratase
VYGAMLGATAEEIESAIGMTVAHYIPWRAIRAGKQLSDSKGASAALSTEVAVLSMQRSMRGFLGPRDIFRNPESMFRQFQKTQGHSPFDLVLGFAGDDFAVMGMHFKLGLYEHQSAGALQGLIDLLVAHPDVLVSPENIASIRITAYEPAFSIIGDPAKRDPHTRQSADHSMVYIVSTMLRKAFEAHEASGGEGLPSTVDAWWKAIMLGPYDYSAEAIRDPVTRALMGKITFEHGGNDYDRRYPDGIPTSLTMELSDGRKLDSGLVMYPAGHARNTTANLRDILAAKFAMLGRLGIRKARKAVRELEQLEHLSAKDLRGLYNLDVLDRGRFE